MAVVSVIIPTYNRADHIEQAIRSVLDQTHEKIEIIVINDGSSDDTSEVLAKYEDNKKIKLLQNERNKGRSRTRNRGIKQSQGEYICILDDDDQWAPTKVEKQVERFDQLGPEYALVYTWAFVKSGQRTVSKMSDTKRGNIYPEILGSYELNPHTSYMIRSSCLDEIGGYDPEFQYGEDWDLTIRIGKQWKVDYIPEYLSIVNSHEGNLLSIEQMAHYDKMLVKFNEEFQQYPEQRRRLLANKYEMKGLVNVAEKDWFGSVRAFSQSFRTRPSSGSFLLTVFSLLGPRSFDLIRNAKYTLTSMRTKEHEFN